VGHQHTVEAVPGPSSTASVLTDIGGDVGAAVVYVPERLVGLEIEIRPTGADWDGTHTAVRERHLGDHTVICAAFFGSLGAGGYDVRIRGDHRRELALEVHGGRVTEASW
jgi:hypothetical protein